MGAKLTVQIDAALVEKMRAKAVADGLPGANSMPDEELLSALISALAGEEAGGATSGTPSEKAPPLSVSVPSTPQGMKRKRPSKGSR